MLLEGRQQRICSTSLVPFRPSSVAHRVRSTPSKKFTAVSDPASGLLRLSVDVPTCSHMSLDEEFLVLDDSTHPIIREGKLLLGLQRQFVGKSLEEKVRWDVRHYRCMPRWHKLTTLLQSQMASSAQVTILSNMDRVRVFLARPG